MPGLISAAASASAAACSASAAAAAAASFDILPRFDNLTLHSSSVQSSLLRHILLENSSCEYLQQLPLSSQLLNLLSSRTDDDDDDRLLSAFRKIVPLVSHSDIRPFIERIADGGRQASQGILTAAPVEGLCLSSGTTDAKPKYLLYHEGLKNGTIEVARVAAAFRQREFPVTEKGGRILELLFCGQFSTTKGGLKAGTATTHMIRGGAFARRQSAAVGLPPCTPHELTVLAADCRQAMYCHLLAGLIHSDNVLILSAPFAFTLVEAIRSLQSLWPRLCNDIRYATIDAEIIPDANLRRSAAATLLRRRRPNAALADRLAATFRALRSNSWRAAVPTIWPRCRYILSILTGAMEPYAAALSAYAGEVPLISADYAATEGWIGINVSPASPPSEVSFTIHPSLAFFEFIPLYRRRAVAEVAAAAAAAAYEEGEPVGMADVKVGQEYEIVMSTEWGLYRYRLGDVVRVTGFYNAAPQVQYVCRRNVLLSINIDKVTEKDITVAVDGAVKTASKSGLQVLDYTSYAHTDHGPPHYVVFWELDLTDTSIDSDLTRALTDCASSIDIALFSELGYSTSRKMGTISSLELCVVSPGSFSKLLDRYLSRATAAMTQYKTPRCLCTADSVALLRSCAVTSVFSSATF